MQRLIETVTDQFRDAMFDLSESDDPLPKLRALIGIYFEVVADLHPISPARLVLWADAVANPAEDTRTRMVAADREFREAIEKRIGIATTAGQLPSTVHPHGLATVIVAMLRGVALQSLIDEDIDLDAARSEVEALVVHRLAAKQEEGPS